MLTMLSLRNVTNHTQAGAHALASKGLMSLLLLLCQTPVPHRRCAYFYMYSGSLA